MQEPGFGEITEPKYERKNRYLGEILQEPKILKYLGGFGIKIEDIRLGIGNVFFTNLKLKVSFN